MKKTSLALVLFCLAVSVTGCGRNEIGETCSNDEIGGTDDCVDGAICTNSSSGGDPYCRKICTDTSECTGGQSCNGVSGSNQKSCQP